MGEYVVAIRPRLPVRDELAVKFVISSERGVSTPASQPASAPAFGVGGDIASIALVVTFLCLIAFAIIALKTGKVKVEINPVLKHEEKKLDKPAISKSKELKESLSYKFNTFSEK